ncbi:MAG: hypothetical protein V4510_00555 [bacterium]
MCNARIGPFLAILVLLAPLAALPSDANPRDGTFLITSGHTFAFPFHVERRQLVQFQIAFDSAVVTGLHVKGQAHCSDPAISGTMPLGGVGGLSDCGFLDPGMYWIALTLESGAARGTVTATGAKLG